MAKDLTWTATKQGNKLHVAYRYENHSGGVVYVNDGQIIQMGTNTFVKFTNNADLDRIDDTTVRITIGTPTGDVPAAAPTPGIYVAVAKGAAFDGARDIPLPLSHTDAMGRATPLGAKQAKLALYVSDGEPAKWREIATDKGTVKIPDAPNIRIIETDAQPLP